MLIIVMIITRIIMNMQNKLYTIQLLPPSDQFAAPKKFKLLAKRRFKVMENEKSR